MNRPFGFVLFFLVIMTVVGCSKGDKQNYANVSGTVNYNGRPLDKGQITFSVAGLPPTSMDIIDGKFAGQAVVGSNKVSISAKKRSASAPKLNKAAEIQMKGYMEKLKGEGQSADFDPTLVEYIPPEYGTESKVVRVVEAGATNDFQFDIRGHEKQ
jgi:hypothetical protein